MQGTYLQQYPEDMDYDWKTSQWSVLIFGVDIKVIFISGWTT